MAKKTNPPEDAKSKADGQDRDPGGDASSPGMLERLRIGDLILYADFVGDSCDGHVRRGHIDAIDIKERAVQVSWENGIQVGVPVGRILLRVDEG